MLVCIVSTLLQNIFNNLPLFKPEKKWTLGEDEEVVSNRSKNRCFDVPGFTSSKMS